MKGILAILMAGIMVAAMVAPAMSEDATSSATVGDVAPHICYKTEGPDDGTASGVQINPVPNGTKTVTITACVCDGNGNADIGSVTAAVTDNATGGTNFSTSVTLTANASVDCSACSCVYNGVNCTGYTGTFTMAYNVLPGMYDVVVTAVDADNSTLSDELGNQFEYMEGIGISVANMAFGAIAPGGSANSSHMVTNLCNGVVDFDANTTTGDYDYGDAEIMWDDFTTGVLEDGDMITTYTGGDIAVSGNLAVPFTLNVPAGTPAATYTGTTYFTPSKAV